MIKILTPRTTVITPAKKSKSNKKNIDKSNKIDNNIDLVTHNRYAPLEGKLQKNGHKNFKKM